MALFIVAYVNVKICFGARSTISWDHAALTIKVYVQTRDKMRSLCLNICFSISNVAFGAFFYHAFRTCSTEF